MHKQALSKSFLALLKLSLLGGASPVVELCTAQGNIHQQILALVNPHLHALLGNVRILKAPIFALPCSTFIPFAIITRMCETLCQRQMLGVIPPPNGTDCTADKGKGGETKIYSNHQISHYHHSL